MVKVAVHPRYRCAYVVEDEVAIFVKYADGGSARGHSDSRKSIATRSRGFLRDELREVFVTLACGLDGVVSQVPTNIYKLGQAARSESRDGTVRSTS